ncbi:MAG: hypothetical protein QF681_00390 [Vicinamibacterales bacterium]|jgi:hypothetical protein|nr:hypothetical protein [Vicinamibacterales bacterium]
MDVFIPFAMIVLIGWAIYLDHKWKMALAEKGMELPPSRLPRLALGGGLASTLFGVVLFIALSGNDKLGDQLAGIVFGAIGIGPLILYAVIRERTIPQ